MKNRFVVYFEESNNIHHYFETYDEARKYIICNNMRDAYIAKVLAYCKVDFIELEVKTKI